MEILLQRITNTVKRHGFTSLLSTCIPRYFTQSCCGSSLLFRVTGEQLPFRSANVTCTDFVTFAFIRHLVNQASILFKPVCTNSEDKHAFSINLNCSTNNPKEMAEPIEVTTWPKHKNIFYEITASAFTFEVKGLGNALISLTYNLKRNCECSIQMDCNSYTYIRHCNNNSEVTRKSQRTPNLMSNSEYRRFWISWYGGWIAFGRYNENMPIISLAAPKNKIKYISFGTCNDRNVVYWRFDLPPLFKQPALKLLSGAPVRWVHAGNAGAQLPDDALIGGYENEFLYIIRASHRGSLTLGKFVPSLGLGFVSLRGSSNEKSEFEVLCGYDCSWVPSNSNRISMDAIEFGLSDDYSEQLYVGRAKYKGHLIPGKVSLSHKVCYMVFEGREVSAREYELLVYPNATHFRTKRLLTSSFSELNLLHIVNEGYDEYENYDDDDDDDENYDDISFDANDL